MVLRRYRKSRRERYDQWKSLQMPGIRGAFVKRLGVVVQAGPFRGMRYLHSSMGSALVPKLVGSYEAEISRHLAAYCSPDRAVRVVDIGCDEGYYAVGMALRMPSARVYGFDINPAAQKMCRELARINQVEDRVSVEGACSPARLEELLRPGDLVICDCEGCEYAILDPGLAPSLRYVHLIVELHDSDFLEWNITPTLKKRFEETHSIEILDAVPRRGSDWPEVAFLDREQQDLAVDEGRTLGQQWAVMQPRS